MGAVRESTIAGFNKFIDDQKKASGEATIKLVQFDSAGWPDKAIIETVFDCNIKDAPYLTQDTFVPRGGTPLYDAEGRTIIELGEELSKLDESERPSKVVVAIITDGMNNASEEYTLNQVAKMIKHQQDIYSWEFLYLAANQDAVQVGATMNIPQRSSLSYNANPRATLNVMAAASTYTKAVRSNVSMDSLGFSDEDRAAAKVDNKGEPEPVASGPAKAGRWFNRKVKQ